VEQTFRRLYEEKFGEAPASILQIEGDGSSRQMYRVIGDDGMITSVGVVGPDHDENRAFLSYSRAFRSIGLPVPEIYAVDEEAGLYLEEDLGETTLFDAIVEARAEDPGPTSPRP
jgi:aminoglycoside/choline kinase family phosphotransferase